MEPILYKLPPNENRDAALKQAATEIKSKLQAKFGSSYIVTADGFIDADKKWSHQIKVRQGNKIGAAVDFEWDKSAYDDLKLDVVESSKIGSTLLKTILFPAMFLGAFLGFSHIGPFSALPGQKIAAGLGALIMLIPALILLAIIKPILLKGEKEQNAKLADEVRQALQN